MKGVKEKYCRIIFNEATLTTNPWHTPSADEMYGIATQIGEIAESALVLRSYNNRYNLTKNERAYESVGAHTNIVSAIADRALGWYRQTDNRILDEGYSYREIMEAVRLHDLPENLIGDIPDNDSHNEVDKRRNEKLFYDVLYREYPPRDAEFIKRVAHLLDQMEDKSSSTGRLIYCADKVAAVMVTLQYDLNETPPVLRKCDHPSERDFKEMSLCDKKVKKGYRASEMWTIDWFKARKLAQYDETGFFTSLVIMRTLQVNGCWYHWRENDYRR
ncbi:HD domain-containing protein [Candidatus Saccharibacteria bacterium]|nr:HD domain-containing protein [Candidatus Saccharibacteria bacterium]